MLWANEHKYQRKFKDAKVIPGLISDFHGVLGAFCEQTWILAIKEVHPSIDKSNEEAGLDRCLIRGEGRGNSERKIIYLGLRNLTRLYMRYMGDKFCHPKICFFGILIIYLFGYLKYN